MDQYVDDEPPAIKPSKPSSKALILYFDSIFPLEPQAVKSFSSPEKEDESIEKNLRHPKRLKALLDSAHTKGYAIYLLAFSPVDGAGPYVGGITLVLKYLNKALGRNRSYLSDETIYTFSQDVSSKKLNLIVKNIIDDFHQKFSTNSPLLFLGPAEIQKTLTTFGFKFIVVQTSTDEYLEKLSNETNFKHGYYNYNQPAIDASNELGKELLLLNTSLIQEKQNSHQLMLESYLAIIEMQFLKLRLNQYQKIKNNSLTFKGIEDFKKNYCKELEDIVKTEKVKFINYLRVHQDDIQDESRFLKKYDDSLKQLTTNYSDISLRAMSVDMLEAWNEENENQLEIFLEKVKELNIRQAQQEANQQPMKEEENKKIQQKIILQQEKIQEKKQLYINIASPVSLACLEGNLTQFRILKKSAKNLFSGTNEKAFLNEIDEALGLAPIHIIGEFGHIDFLNYLISYNVDLELKNNDQESGEGYQPLHFAVLSNQEEVVKILLDKQVDVNAQGRYKRTALYTGIQYGSRMNILELLVNAGANVNLAESEGRETPLHLAARMGKADIVGFLLDTEEIDRRKLNKNKETAFMQAVVMAQESVVNQFTDRGYWFTRKEWENLLSTLPTLPFAPAKAIVKLLEKMHLNPLKQLAQIPKICEYSITTWNEIKAQPTNEKKARVGSHPNSSWGKRAHVSYGIVENASTVTIDEFDQKEEEGENNTDATVISKPSLMRPH